MGQPAEAIGTPLFTAYAVMHEKQAIRIVFLFDGSEPWIIRAPEGLLPGGFEEIAFRDVRGVLGRNFAQGAHGFGNRVRMTARARQVGFVARNTRIGSRSIGGDDSQ